MEELTIEQLATFQKGFAFKSSDYRDKGIRIIKVSNLNQQRFDDGSCVFIDESIAQQYARYELATDDIVISTVGSWINNPDSVVGKVACIPSSITGSLLNQNAVRLRANDKIMQKYLYYALSSDDFRNYIVGTAQGSANQASITLDDIKKYSLSVPAYETQSRIINILSSIESKIELNQRINDNLEQQAQAAFNNIIANSTSDKTVQLAEIAWLNPKRSISKGTIARSIEMAHLPTTGSFPSGWEMKEYNGGMKFQNGDTLMARITPCLENGKVAFVNFLEDDEIAFGSTEYITMTPKRQFAPEVLYFLVRNAEFIDFAVKNMNGSSGRQRVSADTIGTYELPDITLEELHMLETIAREALTKIKYNSLENMRLAEMRDTLLPKLMSGELKINEIDC